MKVSPVLKRFFVSYLAVALFPVLIMSMVYYLIYVDNMAQSSETAHYNALTQMKSQIDFMIKDFHSTATRVMLQEDISGAMVKQDESAVSSIIRTSEMNSLTPFTMMLYRRGDKYIYLKDGKIHYEVFRQDVADPTDLTMSGLFGKINGTLSPAIVRIGGYEQQNKTHYLAFLYPYPLYSQSPYLTLGFLLGGKQLDEVTANFMEQIPGALYIFWQDMSLLYCNENMTYTANLEAVARQRGTGVMDFGREQIIMRSISEETGLIYCYVSPKQSFYSKTYHIRRVLSITIITVVVCGFLFAIVLSVINYRPLRKLMKMTTADDVANEKDEEDEKNEYDTLTRIFRNQSSENKTLLLQIDNQRPMVYQQCLQMLLQGRYKDITELEYALRCANISLQHPNWFVATVQCMAADSDKELMSRLLENIIREDAIGYGLRMGEDTPHAILFNCNDNCEPQTILNDTIELLQSQSVQAVKVGIGRVYTSPLKMDSSFLEACVALQMRPLDQSCAIFVYENTPDTESNIYVHPTMEYELYTQSVQHANSDVALEALGAIVEGITTRNDSFLLIRSLFFDLLNTLARILGRFGINYTIDEINRFHMISSIEEFRRNTEEMTLYACEQISEQRSQKNKQQKLEIMKYCDESFCDSQISLETVAGHFGVSVSYLARFFRNETGQSFNQYITVLRMDAAKRFLRETDLRVKDIVEQIGYMDVASFTRKFKSLEGVPPGTYRNFLQKPND